MQHILGQGQGHGVQQLLGQPQVPNVHQLLGQGHNFYQNQACKIFLELGKMEYVPFTFVK